MPEQRPVPKSQPRQVRIPRPGVRGPNRMPPRFVSPRGRRLLTSGKLARARQEVRRRRPSTIRQLERFRASDIKTVTVAPREAARFERTRMPKNARKLGTFISQKRANETARTASIRLGVPASNFTIVKTGSFRTLFVTRP